VTVTRHPTTLTAKDVTAAVQAEFTVLTTGPFMREK